MATRDEPIAAAVAHPPHRARARSSTSVISADTRPPTAARRSGRRCSAPTASTGSPRPTSTPLRPLGLRTVIDLRTPDEIDEHGRFPLDAYTVELPPPAGARRHRGRPEQIETFGDVARPFLVDRVPQMLVIGDGALGESLRPARRRRHLPSGVPLRSGQGPHRHRSPALVLALLGVPDDVIAEDYALSRDGVARLHRAGPTVNMPELVERIDERAGAAVGAEPETIRAVLRAHPRRARLARGVRRARSASRPTHDRRACEPRRSLGCTRAACADVR